MSTSQALETLSLAGSLASQVPSEPPTPSIDPFLSFCLLTHEMLNAQARQPV